MEHRQTRVSLFAQLVVLSGLLVGLAPAVRADDNHPQAPGACSNLILKGSYGFYRTGVVAGSPVVSVGIIVYDGHGKATISQSMSFAGAFDFDLAGQFLYQIDEDCTGKAFNGEGEELARLVVFDDGKGVYFMGEQDGAAVIGVVSRIHGPGRHDN